MNNPFYYTPDPICDSAFQGLLERLEMLKESQREEDIRFCRELEEGKMLGVLIANDKEGLSHTLYAFSGQVGSGGFHYLGFVGPVFDYLRPDGYFKIREREISQQNRDIADFKEEILKNAQEEYEREKARLTEEVAIFKNRCRKSKLERDARRKSGVADEAELNEMIRQSQFEKAELHRLKKRVAADLKPFEEALQSAQSKLSAMKETRRKDSEELQRWLFDNFKLINGRGESRSLSEIFAETPLRIPPSGAGECCAPKLLQAAYLEGWQPVAMAEYWYGKPKGGEIRRHGDHYPACRGKCLPVLRWMLQGVETTPALDSEDRSGGFRNPEIIYENEWFCVVDKPSGMLSVPGKGAAVSVEQWLMKRYGSGRFVRMVHRLDQDTSGLIIAAFNEKVLKTLQALFSRREVSKTYIAELEGDYRERGLPEKGVIELPLSPDWLDRPRQRVDFEGGKGAVTEYEFIRVREGRSRVMFHPHTGRTHQLRVHSASESGLDMPIAGDRLYGKRGGAAPSRLLLHAHKIEFTFPLDGGRYSFESPLPF